MSVRADCTASSNRDAAIVLICRSVVAHGLPYPLREDARGGKDVQQVIATGKWSKVLKRWQMVVAIRRPAKDTPPPRRQPTRPAK